MNNGTQHATPDFGTRTQEEVSATRDAIALALESVGIPVLPGTRAWDAAFGADWALAFTLVAGALELARAQAKRATEVAGTLRKVAGEKRAAFKASTDRDVRAASGGASNALSWGADLLAAALDPEPGCASCSAHYGEPGLCDEGKPVASPHRRVR